VASLGPVTQAFYKGSTKAQDLIEACIFHNKRLGIAFKNVNGHNFLYHSKIHEHGTSIFRFSPNWGLFLTYEGNTHKKKAQKKKKSVDLNFDFFV
jgi:hypothetical protein